MGIFVQAVFGRAREDGFTGRTISEFMAWVSFSQSKNKKAYLHMIREAQMFENDLTQWAHDKCVFEMFSLLEKGEEDDE